MDISRYFSLATLVPVHHYKTIVAKRNATMVVDVFRLAEASFLLVLTDNDKVTHQPYDELWKATQHFKVLVDNYIYEVSKTS